MPRRKDQDGLYQRGDSPFWWASYTGARGARTRRSTETADRKEAEALLAKWKLAAHLEKQWDAPPSHTFDELMLNYLQETKSRKRSSERDRYSAKQLYTAFTGRTLDSLTAMDIRGYSRQRQAAGAQPATINKELRLLSAALNYAAREWGWVTKNPVHGRTLPEPEGRIRWLSIDEAQALIEAAEAEPQVAAYLPDFIRLALHTGMRKGELLGLEWSRVDFSANLIHLAAINTKNGKRRSIPLNDTARSALIHRAGFRAKHCPASPWVFCDTEGERIANVRRSFDTACRKSGIVDFHIHDLRHTCAARMVSAGIALAEVRDLLGHASITMTERYAHLAPENIRAAVAVLDRASRSGHAESEEKTTNKGNVLI